MKHNLFSLPVEVRLQIYEKVLVLSEPIIFVADKGPALPPLFLRQKYGLSPTLLRTNRKVYEETRPLLYSKNCFKFPDVYNESF